MNDGMVRYEQQGMAQVQPLQNGGPVLQGQFVPGGTAIALATQAEAQIKARYAVALQRPRDWEQVRMRLKASCARYRFADMAIYKKPIGGQKKAEGFSIRFAEEFARCAGNLDSAAVVVDDNPENLTVRVTVTDIENNTAYHSDTVVPKCVERSSVPQGTQPLSVRTNSNGNITYLLPATPDQVLMPKNNAISKELRNNTLRHCPADIQDECKDWIKATIEKGIREDPNRAKRALLDSFAERGVMPEDLAEYLGHDTAQLVPAEIMDLRAIYAAISTGETTWKAVLDSKHGGDLNDAAKADAELANKAVNSFKEKLRNKKQGDQAQPPEQPKDDAKEAKGSKPKAQPHPEAKALQDGQQNLGQQQLITATGETVPADKQ